MKQRFLIGLLVCFGLLGARAAFSDPEIQWLNVNPATATICYDDGDSVEIVFYLTTDGGLPIDEVTITLEGEGNPIIHLYNNVDSGTHTVYWDGSADEIVATRSGPYTWDATRGDLFDLDWNKHNGTYSMEAIAVEYGMGSDTASWVTRSSDLIEVDVLHFNEVIQNYGGDAGAWVPPYTVNYQLTKDAKVTIEIYKEDPIAGGPDTSTLVRRIEDDVPRPAGANTQFWDGKNDSGTIVQNGNYIMTLDAFSPSGCLGLFDPVTDSAVTRQLRWAVDILRLTDWSSVAITPDDPDGGAISYTLSHDANVTIKIYPEGTTFNDSGLPDPDTNPIITLVDSPRQAGFHTENWTGVNDTGLLAPNAVYTYVISAQLHGVRAVDYVGNVCPFYGTISVGRKAHKIDPPTNLTSSRMGQRRLQLRWNAPTNNIGDLTYNIYRSTQPITSQNASLIVDTTSATTWIDEIDTSLVGLDLYYRVTAMDSVCPESYESSACADYESEFSNILYLQAPSRPELISITKGRHPTLNWKYPFYNSLYGPRYYEVIFNIYRSDTTPVALTETNRIASNIQDNVRTYTDGDVEYDKLYWYVVTAVNIEPDNGLESMPSSPKSGHSYFYEPSNLTASNEDGPIRLNWTAAWGAVGEITYNIYRDKQVATGNPTKIIDGDTYYLIKTGEANTTYLDGKTSHGTRYCYRVTAIDGSDNLESLPANEKPCPISEYLIIPIPAGLGATCVNRGINLTWNQENTLPTISYTYKVYRSLEPWVLVDHTAELVAKNLVFSNWRDENVENGDTYYYRVSAVSKTTGKEGDPSDTASATSLFLPPTGSTATNDNGVIDLEWNATGGFGEITYNIYRSDTDDVSKDSTKVASGISVTHWTDINTDNGRPYWYIITAVDAFDNLESIASNADSETSIYPADPRPQKLRAECVNRNIGLTWQAHSTFTGAVYTIYRGTSSPPTTVVATNISATTWTDTNVANQITYYYHVTANQGPGNPSNEAYATSSFSAPTNLVATNNNGLSINLSWNPTSGFGTITYNIYRDLQSTISTSSPKIAAGVSGTTYSDTNIVFGTQYYYLVTGVDNADSVESLSSLSARVTATHISPAIASISMTNIDLESESAIITYTVTNGPARQVEIVIIDEQTGQEVATIIKTVGQNGVCTASWDGVWTNEQGMIKHNGWYSARARAMDVDNSLSDWTATTSDAYVDVVHIQQPVEFKYTTEGQDPPVLGPHYHITYQLTKNAYVTHKIYSDPGRTNLVRTISSDVPRMGEGFERITTVTDYWDLRATNGSFVPNGIYYWQITAHYESDTSTVIFDLPVQPLRLTDLSTVAIKQLGDKAQINYTLTVDATVTIKIYPPNTTFDTGGNPSPDTALVRTLTFSREEGSHTEEWDGLDETGLLVANGVYMMSIIALDSHGNRAVDYNGNECPFYGNISVQREAHQIDPPTGLSAKNMDGVIQLSWTGPTNNIGNLTYNLYRNVNAGVSPSSYSDSHPGLTSAQFSDTNTVDGTVYYYVVTAIDSSNPTYKSNPSNLTSAQAVYPKPPTIPGNLTTQTIARKIKLIWGASSVIGGSHGSVFYRIYRSQSSSVDTNDTANRIANNILTTEYTDNVSTGSYYYKVTAVDNSNNLESDGNEAFGTSFFAAPTNLVATNEDGPIKLTWETTSGFGFITYNVYRDASHSVSTASPQIATGLNSTNWTDFATDHNTLYYYVVTGVDAFDTLESKASNIDSERAIFPILEAPSDLTATVENRAIKLAWKGISDTAPIYAYNIYRSTSSPVDITDTNKISGGGSATKYTDQKIIDQIRFYYVITTENLTTGLESGPSNEVFVTSIFKAPTELKATNNYGAIDLEWKPATGIGSITYNIYRDINPLISMTSTRIATGLTNTKYRDAKTDDGITYYYIVTGVDDYDTAQSLPSDMASARAEYLGAPTAPTNLKAKTVDRKIELTWEASKVSGASKGGIRYNIYRSISRHGTTPDTNSLIAKNITATNYVDARATDQVMYYYVVTAVDDSTMIESASSNEAIGISYFLPPKGLTATNKKGIIDLSWTETKGISLITYKIYRRTASTSMTEVAGGIMGTEWQDLDTANGVTYYYVVTAVDNFDYLESQPSKEVSEMAIYPKELLSISVTTDTNVIEYESNGQPDSVTITFTINAGDSDSKGNPSRIETTVISIGEAASFLFENLPSGTYSFTWDGTWDIPGQWIKHNGPYTITATITNYDGASPLPGRSGVYVDVVHFNSLVKEYINIGQNPEAYIQPYNVIYQLTKDALVTIRVHEYDETSPDNLGDTVRTIVDEAPRPGEGLGRNLTNEMLWDGKDDSGKLVPNGIYILTLDANESKLSQVPGTDRAIQQQVSLAVDTLRLLDLESKPITGPGDLASVSYTLSTDATVYINIYPPGTTFILDADSNPAASKSLVKTLLAAPREEGSHTETWDGTNDTGQKVANGVYVFTIMVLDTHGNRATNRYGNECPFYGTIPVYRGVTQPTLSWTGKTGYTEDGVSPDKDKAGDTFTFRISYAHQDNTPPDMVRLHIFKGGTAMVSSPFEMTGVDPYDNTYSDSKLYTVDVALTELGTDYTYYFEARDINKVPATGIPTRNIAGSMKKGPIVDNTPIITINQIDRANFPQIDCYVTVTDQAGDHLGDLNKDDFKVFEDGVGRTLAVKYPSTTALSTALVMDYSGSMLDPDVVNAEAAANIFVDDMADTDKAAIIKFDEIVSLIQSFTSKKSLLRSAISTPYSRGATAFYDAVYLGITETANQPGRKAVVAFTDGMDNSSTHTVREVITYSHNNSIPVFTIGLGSADEWVLSSIARGTGGQYYYAPTSSELVEIFEKISTALSNQYQITYTTPNPIPDGQLREVTIEVSYKGEPAKDEGQYQASPDTSPPTGAPSAPVWIEGEFTSSTDITCTWTQGTVLDIQSGISGYYLEVATGTAFKKSEIVLGQDVGNVLRYTVKDCLVGSTYYARVRAKNLSGEYGTFSDISKGIKIVSEQEEEELNKFSKDTVYGYPNPVRVSQGEVVTFRYALGEEEAPADITIKVYTITGELLWEKEIPNQPAGIYKNETWDVQNKGGKSVASGLYIYSVQKNDDKPIIKKLIVIR